MIGYRRLASALLLTVTSLTAWTVPRLHAQIAVRPATVHTAPEAGFTRATTSGSGASSLAPWANG